MAHFAELDPTTMRVTRVIVVSNQITYDQQGQEHEELGIAFCRQLYGAQTEWAQTSYNGSFRGKYAGIGDLFDPTQNIFIAA